MDTYEKAYKAVLQTATQWIKDGCTDKEKICLECVFPELRESESEDERVRKCIVATIEQCPDDFLNPKNRDRMLAYLEKQKEQKPINSFDIVPYIDDKIAALQDMWREEKVAFDWDDIHEMIEDVARHFYQKEQKSAWSEEDEKMFASISNLLWEGYGCFKENRIPTPEWHKIRTWLKSIRPSWKPSEEQMSSLKQARDYYMSGRIKYVGRHLSEIAEQLEKLM